VRALAVTGARRESALPDVPTAAETVASGYSATSWFTIAAPRGLPAGLVEKLHADLRRALAESGEEFRSQGIGLVLNSPAEAARFVAAETEKWNRVIDAAKIQVE
jgi:tripartite-type tricarboxylate transporter receptor subunit TctC